MGKWKTKTRFTTSPRPDSCFPKPKQNPSQTLAPVQRGALRVLAHGIYKFGNIFS